MTTSIKFWILILCLGVSLSTGCGPGNEKRPEQMVSKIDGKEMVLVPEGEFIMGTDRVDAENTHMKIGTVKPLYVDQHPERKTFLEDFYIDRYEVTNREFKRFVDETQFVDVPENWEDESFSEGKGDHPATNITWAQASAYAFWAGKRLPTEAQWEKAARGTDGRTFPWGNEYQKGDANIEIDGDRETSAVGAYPRDVSPYGVYDMEGNVMEWTRDWYLPYPGSKFATERYGKQLKVLRGNAFQKAGHYFLPAYRFAFHRTEVDPGQVYENVGFRCVLETAKPE